MSVLTVLGSRIEVNPPNTSKPETRIMGMEQCTSTNSPKMTFPKIAAILPTPVCIPIDVDLKKKQSYSVIYSCSPGTCC